MKKLLILILSIISFVSFGQTNDASLKSESNTNIRLSPASQNKTATVIDHVIENKVNLVGGVVASGTNTYTATVSTFTAYSTGLTVDVNFTNGNSGASTLNVNGIGAISIRKNVSGTLTALSSGDISAGQPLRLFYNGTYFVIEGATSSTVTASNGLTKVVNDIQLGGTLSAPVVTNLNSQYTQVLGSQLQVTHNPTDYEIINTFGGSAINLDATGTQITAGSNGRGLTGAADYSGSITGLDYAQKNYVDNAVSASGFVPTTRTISTTSPLSGGGDLSADRTLSIANAAADGTTKGAATFTAADFNATTGLISLDYANGQKATTSLPGFLSAADWTTFNGKVSSQWVTTGSDIYYSTGNVMIGVAVAPSSKLTVSNQSTFQSPVSGSTEHIIGVDANPLRLTYDTHNNASASGTAFMIRRSRGTAASPSALSSGDVIAAFSGRGYGTSQYAAASTGLINIKANQTFTNANNGTYISFDATPDNSVTAAEVFRFGGSGQFGIGGANFGTSGNTIISGGSAAAVSWGQYAQSNLSGLGTGVSTWLGSPSWTNFNSAITGTSPYWALTGTSTLTGAVTIAQGGNNTTFSGTGKVTFNPTTTISGLNVGSFAGDPATTVDGDLWYNTTTTTLRSKIASTLSTMTWLVAAPVGTRVPFLSGANGGMAQNSNFTFNNANSTLSAIGFLGSNISASASITVTQSAMNAASWVPPLKITNGTHTNLAASTEYVHNDFTGSTQQWLSGTLTDQRWTYFRANTASFTIASTLTNAYSVYIDPPVAGTNATITNNWALGVNGATKLIGSLTLSAAGNGISIKEGTNATMGLATLVAGTVVVSTNKVTANSRILLTGQNLGTITVPVGYAVSARTAGTSFTILSANAVDTSTIAWQIIEPAP